MKSIVKIVPGKAISRIGCELPDGAAGIEYSQKEKAVVFYCPCDGAVGFVGDDGAVRPATRRAEVGSPVGMCCDRWGIVVLQLSPEMLWSFDQSYGSGMRMCGAGVFAAMSRTFGDVPSAPYGVCRVSLATVAMAVPAAGVVAWVRNGRPADAWGSGRKGFLSSTSTRAAMFDSPSGVCFDEGTGLLFVSDRGNSVVRAFRGTTEVAFVGVPDESGFRDGTGTSARLKGPSAARCSRGLVAFVDGNLVRTFPASTLDVSTPYASSNEVLDVAMGGDAIYALEET